MVPRLSQASALATGAILLARSTVAAADPSSTGVVDLVWDAPAECPSAASIEAEVAKLLPNMPSSQTWHARAVVRKGSEGAWTLHLATEVDGNTDERDFTAASCAELASTAAVVLAIAVDPTRGPTRDAKGASVTGAPMPPPPPPPPPPPVPPLPPPPPPPAPAPAPTTPPAARVFESPKPIVRGARSGPPPSFVVSAAISGSLGVLGTPALGGELGVAWVPRHARLELGALWFPRSDVGGEIAGTGGTFSLIAGKVTGCWLPLDARIRAGACLGVQAGELDADGSGGTGTPSVTPATGRSAWVAATGGGLFVWQVAPRLGLRGNLDLLVPFNRETFYLKETNSVAEPIHTPSPVGAQASVGVEVRFP